VATCQLSVYQYGSLSAIGRGTGYPLLQRSSQQGDQEDRHYRVVRQTNGGLGTINTPSADRLYHGWLYPPDDRYLDASLSIAVVGYVAWRRRCQSVIVSVGHDAGHQAGQRDDEM
jgi:hypothetical protein